MKAKKIVRYRLPVSVKFPATHNRAGEPTYFVEKIGNSIGETESCNVVIHTHDGDVKIWPKLHTIRGNYNLWAKRFEKIQRGEAVLELYFWSGKPYRSQSVTICQLGKDDGVGIEKLQFITTTTAKVEKENTITLVVDVELSKNDGLSLEDFKEWFRGYDSSNPMAIIHFTNFRY